MWLVRRNGVGGTFFCIPVGCRLGSSSSCLQGFGNGAVCPPFRSVLKLPSGAPRRCAQLRRYHRVAHLPVTGRNTQQPVRANWTSWTSGCSTTLRYLLTLLHCGLSSCFSSLGLFSVGCFAGGPLVQGASRHFLGCGDSCWSPPLPSRNRHRGSPMAWMQSRLPALLGLRFGIQYVGAQGRCAEISTPAQLSSYTTNVESRARVRNARTTRPALLVSCIIGVNGALPGHNMDWRNVCGLTFRHCSL